MKLKEKIANLILGLYTKKQIVDYYRANFRVLLLKSDMTSFLLPKHIREQYYFRLSIMKKECLENGECVECGCTTPNLQMTNSACKGLCYPTMMSKKDWKNFKDGKYVRDTKTGFKWKKAIDKMDIYKVPINIK